MCSRKCPEHGSELVLVDHAGVANMEHYIYACLEDGCENEVTTYENGEVYESWEQTV